MEQVCKICQQASDEETITLINGEYVHSECESRISELLAEAEHRLSTAAIQESTLTSTIAGLKTTIRYSSYKPSIWASLYESFAGTPTAQEAQRRLQLTNATSELAKAESDLLAFKNAHPPGFEERERSRITQYRQVLRSVYDYWPGYPPDWDERRNEARQSAGGACERCRFKKYRPHKNDSKRIFHVHHHTPIHKGGNHKVDNLRYLCSRCHQKAHPHSIEQELALLGIPQLRSSAAQKIGFINRAIAQRSLLTFRYRKRDGQVMIRTIMPEAITLDRFIHKVQVVSGYCYLRKAARHFTIARMSQLRIARE